MIVVAEATATKVCGKCGTERDLDCFYRSRGRVGTMCKPCYAARYQANKAAHAARDKAWKKANPDKVAAIKRRSRAKNAKSVSQYRRRRYLANKAEENAASREYGKINRAQRTAYFREWRQANPDRAAEVDRRKRAKRSGAPRGPVDLDALWTGLCGLCDNALDMALKHPDPMSKSIDHIVPLAKGGSHTQDNLQWTHLRCNLRKGARLAA